MTAAMLVVGGASCVLGLLAAAGLLAAGLPVVGSLVFGAGWAATGLCFSAVAAVAAQVTTGSRAANGLGFTVIGLAYGGESDRGPGRRRAGVALLALPHRVEPADPCLRW